MSEIKWIKITTNMFDDEKIRLIESMPEKDTIYYIWIRLLVMAGKTNNQGLIYVTEKMPYTDDMLCSIFNRNKMTVQLALSTFKKMGMIEMSRDGHIYIPNWGKHQSLEGLDKIRESNRLRQAKYRENLSLDNNIHNVTSRNASISISNSYSKSKRVGKKHKYMEFVTLSTEEFFKLRKQFGRTGVRDRCENLNLWKGSKGKKTASDYLTILNWERRTQKSAPVSSQPVRKISTLEEIEKERGIK
jgi:predicted phage replisome organizer